MDELEAAIVEINAVTRRLNRLKDHVASTAHGHTLDTNKIPEAQRVLGHLMDAIKATELLLHRTLMAKP